MSININFSEKKNLLDKLKEKLVSGSIPTAREWGGADVVITSRKPETRGGGFYSEPRYLVTPNAPQVSWLFEQLRDIFRDLYDGCSKIEFFGRLANAALRYQAKCKGNENQHDLLFAVLHEAYAMLEEMKKSTFKYLLVAPGNEIADDSIEQTESHG